MRRNRGRVLENPGRKWRARRAGDLRALGLVVCISLMLLQLIPGLVGAQEAAEDTQAAEEAQKAQEAQEATQGPVAEDELAPVRALQARLLERLAEPVEALDVDLIMEGPGFSGTRPGAVRWDGRGERLWFRWKPWDQEQTGTWEYRLADASLRRLSEQEADLVPAARAVWDRSHRRALWTVGDRVMLYEGATDVVRVLAEGLGRVRPAAFSGDGELAVLRQQNNLLAIAINPGAGEQVVRQITDVRPGTEKDDEPGTESQRWLREQQLALFDVLARREARRLERRDRVRSEEPAPLYLAGWSVDALVPSPDLSWVAVFERREAKGDQVAEVPNYVTTSGYTEEISTRMKVGDELDSERVGILHVASGRVGWVDLDLEGRGVSYAGLSWNASSDKALLQVRADDNKDRWFAVLTPTTEAPAEDGEAAARKDEGAVRDDEAEAQDDETAADESGTPEEESGDAAALTVGAVLAAHDHDDAWINWAVAGGNGWLPDGGSFYFVSERSGWMNLYVVPASGGDATALTDGEFEVFGPRLHPDGESFVFEASIDSPFQVQAYRLPLQGGEPEPLTSGHGRQDVTLSPDGSRLASVASSSNQPGELYVGEAGEQPLKRITESPSPAFASYPWVKPEIVHFTARDGIRVPARLYGPANPDPGHPAVIFVHGAGYLHNVHRWWSSYSREYAFHHLLTERGFTVLDIDYRGSAGYGRDWRTTIYQHMGGQDLEDQIDGAQYLVREHGIDPERIGLYGGSYGGFITLMALFTASDHFAAGAALRPVTDWAHYNHPYTSNILNSPQDDSQAYWASSPIYFAEGLQDPLLICHGVIDTNVHFQGVVRLAQRLIELRKSNWEVAMYPVESHGFVQPASWADEYRRILQLFEDNLK